MTAELGLLALLITLSLSFYLTFLPFMVEEKGMAEQSKKIVLGLFSFILIAWCLHSYGLLIDDFSVQYVAGHSNSMLAWWYKIAAAWAGHEGSLLLWCLFHCGWMVYLRFNPLFKEKAQQSFQLRILQAMAFVLIGLLLFSLCLSNPFARELPSYPLDGADLNPLLQDFGLIIHPPILFLGYSGTAICFAWAVAYLYCKQAPSASLAILRHYILLTWLFLTFGIALGSWWAYYELGWGGWWFWDPVENSPFMPWLILTGLMHLIIVAERKSAYMPWVTGLAVTSFGLSLIGSFIVRSGVISTVHAFALDPGKGLFILGMLIVYMGAAILGFGRKLNFPATENRQKYSVTTMPITNLFQYVINKPNLLTFNAITLTIICFTVLLGTLYPFLLEHLTGETISVGYPYFNAVFIPLILPCLILLSLGLFINWEGKWSGSQIKFWLIVASVYLLLISMIYWQHGQLRTWVSISCVIAAMIITSIGLSIQKQLSKPGFGLALVPRTLAMCCAHLGVAVTLLGIVIVKHYEVEKDIAIQPGATLQVGPIHVVFKEVTQVEGQNYIGFQGDFMFNKEGKKLETLLPEKRVYLVQETAMSETAISPGFWYDVYIALGEQLDSERWSVRVYYKPAVRWIWLGALLMMLGALMGMIKSQKR